MPAATGRREASPGGGLVAITNTGAIPGLRQLSLVRSGYFQPRHVIFFVSDYIVELRNDARNVFAARPAQEQYSPGSTFKIVTLMAAASERLMSPGDLFDCGMEWRGQEFGDTFLNAGWTGARHRGAGRGTLRHRTSDDE
ncbi:MAG: hypothetical protein IPK19_26400 [Chloroflexi bacterium]|nr:hypothetical protein [Chloroflexota bacterium]